MAVADRWATFDCYGTLIDWNGGILRELARVFGDEHAPKLLARYHELEPEVQREDPGRSYADVMTETMRRLGAPEGEEDALGRSLPSWEPFPEVPDALRELRERGWRLAILSNTDQDLLAASRERIGVPFDLSVVASEIGSY
jgi:2-haloacid dehalogenase